MFEAPQERVIFDIQERLAAEVPSLKLIDRYNGQDLAPQPQLAYPAVLIDIEDQEYEEMSDSSQFCRATITVRLFVSNFSSSTQKSPLKSRKEAMKDYSLESEIVSALYGWAPTAIVGDEEHEYTVPMVRVSSRPGDNYEKNVRQRVLTFSTSWEESMADPELAHPAILVDGLVITTKEDPD